MLRAVFFSMIILVVGPNYGQQLQRDIDSLTKLLLRHPAPDTLRLHLLNEISFAYYAVDPAKGLEQANEALRLATRLKHNKGLALAYSRKGINHWARGEDSLAMDANNHAIALHKQSGNWLSYAKGLNNRALNYYNKGDFAAAVRDHQEALAVFSQRHDTSGIQHSYLNMGVVFLALDDYPKALDAFLNAQRYAPQKDILQGKILTNIGLVYKNMHDYAKAHSYQQQALEYHHNTGDKQNEANVLGNLAALFDLTQNTQKAIEYYQRALKLNRAIGNERRIAADLTNIGMIYNHSGNPEKASHYLQQAVESYSKTSDKKGHAEALLALARTYPTADAEKLAMQRKALQIAQDSGSPLRQSEAFKDLSQAYEALGNYNLALNTYKAYTTLKDSISNSEKSKEILRKQLEFDFEQKEALAQAKIDRQAILKNAFLVGGLILLISFIISIIFYKRKRDSEIKEERAEHEMKVTETELKALRAQMNPHFIFNSLNAIADCLTKADLSTARTYLIKFAKLMRLALEHSAHREITLYEDLQFLELYLQVENLRFPYRFSYQINVEDTIDQENVLIPPMLLQPIIENSLWHGIGSLTEQGHIQVDICIKGELLACRITDNGVGMSYSADQRQEKTQSSFGLRLTQERLALLDKNQVKHQIQISNVQDGRGVRVDLCFPLKSVI